MKIAKLRNGREEAETGVRVIMMTLQDLMAKDPITFFELTEVCRKPDHKPWGQTGEKLKQLSLLESTGRVHETIKNVVLSAIEGEGLDLRLRNPVLSTREAE